MKIIIDTHIFLWALTDPNHIAPERRDELKTLTNIIYVSAVSIAEIAIKASVGKLDVDFDILEMIEKSGFSQLAFGCEDACALRDLPFHHRDPFDRMLIAQSITRNYPIMTDDDKFTRYGCELI